MQQAGGEERQRGRRQLPERARLPGGADAADQRGGARMRQDAEAAAIIMRDEAERRAAPGEQRLGIGEFDAIDAGKRAAEHPP